MPKTQDRFHRTEKKRRILLVEDEFINQQLLLMNLDGFYEVVTAATGTQALEIIRREFETLSVILLDLNLPDIHGLDVLREVKSDSRYARLPVIVMTADNDAEAECLSMGAIDFIPKPYPRQEVILARIRRIVELSEDRDILRWTERDQLTGLYNKDFFYHYASQLDTHHQDLPTDALLININHFHTINERYGKRFGDELLRRIARRMLETVQETGGIACRRDADNFMIYCPHRTDYEALLSRLSVGMDETEDEHSDNRVRLRLGVYAEVDKTLDIERRFDRAKTAADTVKGNFSKSVGIYDDSLHERELLNAQLIEDFPRALREKQFEVYFQPKFDVRPETPTISSAEALIRWRHPRLGMVNPGVFIPLFENNGLIFQLDSYVWEEAAARVRDWQQRLGIRLPVSVNVSRIDLYEPTMVDLLRNIITKNELSFRDLCLEVTESAYTEDSELIIAKIKSLRAMGFRIEMDDFGSGYSSLNMFSLLPIDAVKLDMQFIRNAFKARKDIRLLEIMIQLAESFEVVTVAEGVETAEQVFTLKTMGCDIIQGFYFSRPLPPAEFEAFLLENQPSGVEVRQKKKKQWRDTFTYNALHDPLTGLYNSSTFDILFHDSDHDHIAVLIAQIDGYAELVRSLGGKTADRIVCRVANELKKSFRSVDHICRLRAEEFAVIMTRVTGGDRELVRAKIEKINSALHIGEDGLPPVSLSVGVAFSDRPHPEGDVFEDADAALKGLRERGETGYAIFEEK